MIKILLGLGLVVSVGFGDVVVSKGTIDNNKQYKRIEGYTVGGSKYYYLIDKDTKEYIVVKEEK